MNLYEKEIVALRLLPQKNFVIFYSELIGIGKHNIERANHKNQFKNFMDSKYKWKYVDCD